MKKALFFLIAGIFVLGGCSRGAESQTTKPTPQPVAAQSAPAPAAAPWYAERFEALGFHVFPEPTDIPAFTVRAREGGAYMSPPDFKGKITLLNFWATWCPPCRQEMPSIEILHKKMKGEAFAVAAVSVREKPETVDAFLKQNPYTFPIYLDSTGDASGGFVSRGIPTTFVPDKDARAIAAIIGSRSYEDPAVIELFKELARR